jgi:hypothetical protein
VETELAAFNDHFQVFALDPLDAMAVLTPQMIEGIFSLNNVFREPMALYFNENTMSAFISMKRQAFDASGDKTLTEERELLQKDIRLVTDFLDTMYFKRQEGVAPISVAPISAAPVSAAPLSDSPAPDMAAPAMGVGGRFMRYGLKKYLAKFTFRNIILAAFAISAVYTLFKYPYTIPIPTEDGTMDVFTLLYLAIAGFFTYAFSRFPGIKPTLIALAVFGIHLYFITL